MDGKTDILKDIELRFIMSKFDAFWMSKKDWHVLTEMVTRMQSMYKEDRNETEVTKTAS